MNDRTLLAAGKAAAYVVLLLAAALALFRGGVATLWGSASDLGLVAAVLLAAVGMIALVWLGGVMVRDVRRTYRPDEGGTER